MRQVKFILALPIGSQRTGVPECHNYAVLKMRFQPWLTGKYTLLRGWLRVLLSGAQP